MPKNNLDVKYLKELPQTTIPKQKNTTHQIGEQDKPQFMMMNLQICCYTTKLNILMSQVF